MSDSIDPALSLDGAVAFSGLAKPGAFWERWPRRVGRSRAVATALSITFAAATASAQSLPQPRVQSLLVAEVNAW